MRKNNDSDIGFKIVFDKNTIDHLGIKLYSSFPPVIAEMVSNSYDAEATCVDITIDNDLREICITDDGHGMTHEELNDCFLVIGRNRRSSTQSGYSKNGKRKVTGKKGLGKLAVFGIAKTIEVISIASGIKNGFEINYDDLKLSSLNEYQPTSICEHEPVSAENQTMIKIKEITQKNITDINTLAISLSKRLNFYSDGFKVTLINKNTYEKRVVDKKLFFDNLDKEFSWTFPNDFMEYHDSKSDFKFLFDNNVHGEIYTQKTPLKKVDSGFILYAREKLASENTFFDDRANDNFNSYVTGFFNIDFIDENNNSDNIGTARQALLWDQTEDLQKLKYALNKLITLISSDWKKKRAKMKQKIIENQINQYNERLTKLQPSESKSLTKALNKIAEIDDITEDKFEILAESLLIASENGRLQQLIVDISEQDNDFNSSKFLALLSEEKILSAIQIGETVYNKLQVLKTLYKKINDKENENPLRDFIAENPWILSKNYETFMKEKSIKNLLYDSLTMSRDRAMLGEHFNKRVDLILINKSNNEMIIVEFMKPKEKLDLDHITRSEFYADTLFEYFSRNYTPDHHKFFIKAVYIIADGLMEDIAKFASKKSNNTPPLHIM